MGAYLSEPVVNKISTDETNDFLEVGASSMQGWRISQEDAHNCITNFDPNTSFFAVYDGHGGAEVAAYCSNEFPQFLRQLDAYKNSKYEQALKDAFLGFDATLLDEKVIDTLKKLAGEKNPDQEEEVVEEEEEEDLAELCQEGALPLHKVLEKYKGCAASMPILSKLKDGESSGSGTSKPLSPFLRGRRQAEQQAGLCALSLAEGSKAESMETEDSTVSSSCSIKSGAALLDETPKKPKEVGSSNGPAAKSCSPDSSEVKQGLQNGSTSSCVENVSSSSSTASAQEQVSSPSKQENGKLSSPGSSSPAKTEEVSVPTTGITSSTNVPAADPCDNDDDSTSDSDADFQAEENSSTEDGDEYCEPCDDDTEDEECEEEEDYTEDDAFCTNMIEEPGKDSGCTAVVALLHGRDLYVANAGDSRCVVCRGGKAIEMSLDHKPEDEEESARIFAAGGRVTLDGRVNGGLNLSRALGDHAYKMKTDLAPEKQMISALPDVKKLILSPEDEFMVLACDGIWNYMSSDEVVEFVKKRLDEGCEKISQICEQLFDNCLAPNTMGDGTGCDNMTAVIIRFKPKILDLSTSLNPDETESEFLSKKRDSEVQQEQSLKRCASPTPQSAEDSCNNKRLKTDSAAVSASADDKNECDSGSGSTSSTVTIENLNDEPATKDENDTPATTT